MKKLMSNILLIIFFFSVWNFMYAGTANTNTSTNSNLNKQSNQFTINTPTSTTSQQSASSTTQIHRLATLSNPNAAWQEIGPAPLTNPNSAFTWGQAPFSGRITSIAVNQSNPSIIYAGTAQGGVWKTVDAGVSWIPLTDNQSTLATGSVTISSDNTTIFVGTGEPNHSGDSYYGNGILKSSDEGKSWQLLGSTFFNGSAISGIVINSTNPNWMIASTTWASCCSNGLNGNYNSNVGIYLTQDGGQTWATTNILGTLSASYLGVSQLLIDPVNNSIIFASGFRGEVWESQDSGQTWTNTTFSRSYLTTTRVAIGISRSNPNLLFGAFANNSYDLGGIYSYNLNTKQITTLGSLPPNTGQTYGPCNSQCWYDLIMGVDPTNTNILYVGGVDLFRSSNGGATWSIIGGSNAGSFIHPDQHALDFYPGNPSEIFVGNDGGMYSSINTGSTWSNLNSGLRTIQFNTIAASPTDDTVLIGGTQDNGCENYADNTQWSLAHTGDGGGALFYNSTTIICNYYGLNIQKSTDGGNTWFSSSSGINQNDQALFYPPMAQDPSNRSIIYIGSYQLYKSTDFGNNWIATGSVSIGDISTIAVAPSNGSIIYTGDDQGIVQVSDNGGSTWNQILNATNKFGYWIPISSIAVDPMNPLHIFVSFGNQISPRLVISNDMGVTWNTVTNLGQIPDNIAINVMKFNSITNILFLGTDQGFYFYNGTTFNVLGSGLPNSDVADFTFTHSNYIVVATHGRGAWINYMTPTITFQGTASNSLLLMGKSGNVSITDPNGLNQSLYNWDTTQRQTIQKTVIPSPLTLGVHTLYVYAQDIAGNWQNQTFSITVVDNPLLITLNSPTNNSIITTNSTIDFSISDFAYSINNAYYNWDNGTNVTINSPYAVKLTIPFSDGTHNLYVFTNDSGNYFIMKQFVLTFQIPTSSSSSITSSSSSTNTNTQSSSVSISTHKQQSSSLNGFELFNLASFFILISFFIRNRRKKS